MEKNPCYLLEPKVSRLFSLFLIKKGKIYSLVRRSRAENRKARRNKTENCGFKGRGELGGSIITCTVFLRGKVHHLPIFVRYYFLNIDLSYPFIYLWFKLFNKYLLSRSHHDFKLISLIYSDSIYFMNWLKVSGTCRTSIRLFVS